MAMPTAATDSVAVAVPAVVVTVLVARVAVDSSVMVVAASLLVAVAAMWLPRVAARHRQLKDTHPMIPILADDILRICITPILTFSCVSLNRLFS